MANTTTKIQVKQEQIAPNPTPNPNPNPKPNFSIIDLLSSDSDSDSDCSSDDANAVNNSNKRPRNSSSGNVRNKSRNADNDSSSLLPLGFLDPLTPLNEHAPSSSLAVRKVDSVVEMSTNKQFWKAGDYEGAPCGDWDSSNGGMDHVRVHPKFLHSNATSHKWVLGALAELLDNSLDEVCNGATYVNIDMIKSKKDGSKMLLIEDNGGGMDPDKMRHCMSLGYSAKSNMVNTIGQYGNGFKTSTMRLGADVIVFSRSRGKDGRRPTQSIGLLSYTFLKSTGKEDIVVPMLDYQKQGRDWNKIVRSSAADWTRNVETIAEWSPFASESDLLRQFDNMTDQGTRVFIYNLWEDDQGQVELDFDTDPHDIQIRGVNRDEDSIKMAKRHPNSRHFLTYRHSLRSYAAILYLRIPPGFRIILRGKDVEHHNIVNDMMMSQEITYRPQHGDDSVPKESNMVAIVTVGFVKDAKAHIDVQGFNVYHKNRLIKPFWRVWHPAGSDGRGVIGVLEADFVEPAHDKQGFERTTVLARLETRLVQMQRNYWSTNCHKIGYARRRNKNKKATEREISPESFPQSDKTQTKLGHKGHSNGHLNGKEDVRTPRKRPSYADQSPSSPEDSDSERQTNHTSQKAQNNYSADRPSRATRSSINSQANGLNSNGLSRSSSTAGELDRAKKEILQLKKECLRVKEENLQLKEREKRKEEEILGELLLDLQKERDKTKSLEAELQGEKRKYEEISKEQDSLIDIFSEERQRRDIEEENLRNKLKEASNTIQDLLDKVKFMEKWSTTGK